MLNKGRVGLESCVDVVLKCAVLGWLELSEAANVESKEILVRNSVMHWWWGVLDKKFGKEKCSCTYSLLLKLMFCGLQVICHFAIEQVEIPVIKCSQSRHQLSRARRPVACTCRMWT